jgi:hypothetical protein
MCQKKRELCHPGHPSGRLCVTNIGLDASDGKPWSRIRPTRLRHIHLQRRGKRAALDWITERCACSMRLDKLHVAPADARV